MYKGIPKTDPALLYLRKKDDAVVGMNSVPVYLLKEMAGDRAIES